MCFFRSKGRWHKWKASCNRRMNRAIQYLTIAAVMLHSFLCTRGESLLGFCADSGDCHSAAFFFTAPEDSCTSFLEQPVFLIENASLRAEEHQHTVCRHGACHCLESDLSQENAHFLFLLVLGFCSFLPAGSRLNEALTASLLPGERILTKKTRRIHLILDRFLV